jgi:hypothetical protein
MTGAAEREPPPTAMAPIDLRVFMLPQVGQSCVSLDCDMRNFLSNGCPQSRQIKLYIGIVQNAPFFTKYRWEVYCQRPGSSRG